MKRTIRCFYCAHWQNSPIHKILKERNENNENNEKKKKKKKKKNQIQEIRTCQLNNREIKGTTEACRFFKTRLYFYCYASKYWLSIYQCLSRRRNKVFFYRKGIKSERNKKYLYPNCTSTCSQFRDDILPICKKLNINRLGQIQRPKSRKITRRIKQEPRKITRRDKQEPRKITRRAKKRVIKRRT